MGGRQGNPNGHGPHGYFRKSSSNRRIQYSSSDERYDAEDIVESNEDLRDSQLQKAAAEKERLKAEEAQREKDKEISYLRSEIAHFKERVASAYDTDTRHTYERYIKNYTRRLKELLGEK